MKTFAFILFVLNPSGDYSAFALDTGLTRDDCAALHESWAGTLDDYSTVYCEIEGARNAGAKP